MAEDQRVHPDAERFGGWSWSEPHRGEHFRRCSFCGSIHPDDLVSEEVWSPEWSDMKYGWPHKFYVNIANQNPESLFVVSSTYSNKRPFGIWFRREDMSTEQIVSLNRDGYNLSDEREMWFQFAHRAHHFGKFYTIHLSDSNISGETKAAIEKRSGLIFKFEAEQVSWSPVENWKKTELKGDHE